MYWQHGFHWISLDIYLNQPSLSVSPLDGIRCLHRTEKYHFFASWPILVCPWIAIHKRRLHISLMLLLQQCSAYLAHLGWFMRWEVSVHTAAVLEGAASRISSKQHAASLCSSHQAFSPGISLKSKWCNYSCTDTAKT